MVSESRAAVDRASVAPKRPVVLQVVPALAPGGVSRGTIDMVEALVAAGAVALVAAEGGRHAHEVKRVGGRLIDLPLDTKNPLRLRGNARRLEQVIAEEGVDLVHARSRAPAWSALWAARRSGVPLVTTYHGAYSATYPGKTLYNSVMARGDRVIAISEHIARRIADQHGVSGERVKVIHRGVDLEVFDPARTTAPRVATLAEKWRTPDDRPVIMLPGRLTRWKGQLVLLQALAKLKDRDFLCILVGDDQGRESYRREIEKTIDALDLRPKVLVAGHCGDMAAALMLADVVVSASMEPEAFGRVMAEANAMGKPVVAFDHGGAQEIVIPTETGWLAKPGDVDGLGKALRQALSLTADERESLGRRAMAHARERFSKEGMCAKTLDVYEALIAAAWAGRQAEGAAT